MALAVSAAVLIGAFIAAPSLLLQEPYGEFSAAGNLEEAVARGLTTFWQSGETGLPGELRRLVDYWFWWHAIKVVICSLLLAVLVVLAGLLAQRFLLRARGANGSAIGAIVSMLAGGGVLVILLANIQSTAVPLVSLLQVLPGSGAEAEISSISSAIAREVHDPNTNVPAVGTLTAAVEQYHWVLAAFSAAAVIVVGWAALGFWRRCLRCTGRGKRLFAATGAVSSLIALAVAGVGVISVVSALQPGPALMDIL